MCFLVGYNTYYDNRDYSLIYSLLCTYFKRTFFEFIHLKFKFNGKKKTIFYNILTNIYEYKILYIATTALMTNLYEICSKKSKFYSNWINEMKSDDDEYNSKKCLKYIFHEINSNAKYD